MGAKGSTQQRNNDLILYIGAGAAALYLWARFRKPVKSPPLPGSAHPGTGTGEPLRGGAPGQVSRYKTAMPPSTAVELLRLCTASELGSEYTNEAGLMVAAHSALETGQWQSMYNYNFGNITTNGARSYFLNPDTDTVHKYISERSPEEGAMALVRLVLRKYTGAVYYAKTGNPEGYARELKKGGYYEAPESDYAKGLAKLYGQFVVQYGWKKL